MHLAEIPHRALPGTDCDTQGGSVYTLETVLSGTPFRVSLVSLIRKNSISKTIGIHMTIWRKNVNKERKEENIKTNDKVIK